MVTKQKFILQYQTNAKAAQTLRGKIQEWAGFFPLREMDRMEIFIIATKNIVAGPPKTTKK